MDILLVFTLLHRRATLFQLDLGFHSAMLPDSPTRIVHITTVPMSLPFLAGCIRFMRDRGCSVSIICSPGPELGAFVLAEGTEAFPVEMSRRITPIKDVMAIWKIVMHLRRIRPEIVHAHTPKGGLLGMIAARFAKVPVRIYHMRGLPMAGRRGLMRHLLRLTESLACSLSHRVISVGRSLREVALAEGLCASEKIVVLAGGSGQGVNATKKFNPALLPPAARETTRARFDIPREATVIGFVGRIVRDKGIVELAHAWTFLRGFYPDLHLLLVGPFEDQDPIPKAVRTALEADSRVHFSGLDWTTPQLYRAMDIVALPTYREGFPNVVLEAAAMELPVVATRIPGCVDAVIHDVTGLLVPSKDATALAGALRLYIDDPKLRERAGKAARARVLQEFREDVIWEAMHREYSCLLEERGLPTRDSVALAPAT